MFYMYVNMIPAFNNFQDKNIFLITYLYNFDSELNVALQYMKPTYLSIQYKLLNYLQNVNYAYILPFGKLKNCKNL